MKQLVFLFLVESFVTLSLSAIQPYDGSYGARKQPLLKSFEGFKYDVQRGPDGEYEFSYHAGDSYRKESRTSSGLVQGEFAFVAPEGDEYDFKYEADKNGYRVKGDALPLKPEETDEVKEAKEKFFEEYEKVLGRADGDKEEGGDNEDDEEDEDSEEDDDDDDDDDEDDDDEESSEESSEEDDDEEDDEDEDEDSDVDPAKYAIYARYGFAPKSLSESSEESSEEDDDEEDDDEEEEEEEEGGEEGNEEEGNAEEGNEEEGNEEEETEQETKAEEEETNANKEENPNRGNSFSKRVSVQRNARKLDGINKAVFAHFGKRIPKAIYVRRAK